MLKNPILPFNNDVLQGIADVLGETTDGFTGSEIEYILAEIGVSDVTPMQTKRYRLFNALAEQQNKDEAGDCIVAFMTKAMTPVRYHKYPARFYRRQNELNEVLIYAGYCINDKGEVARAKGGKATTLEQAAERTGNIISELCRRGIHPYLLRYCTIELLQKNNFHTLLEASKSIPERIRDLTGQTTDGTKLVNATLTLSSGPLLAINSGRTESERSEQSGFANLVIGLLGLYRNPTAHDPKLTRIVSDEELLEALTTISMVHRRLDDANHIR